MEGDVGRTPWWPRARSYLLVWLRTARTSTEKGGVLQQGSALPSFPGSHLIKALWLCGAQGWLQEASFFVR